MNFEEYDRQKRFNKSAQLTLSELILKLSTTNQEAHLAFDFDGYVTDRLMSWRGSYSELAIDYKQKPTGLKVNDLLARLKKAIGETFEGYKGGAYIMGKYTPVWISHFGDADNRAVVGVKNLDGKVVIETQEIEN